VELEVLKVCIEGVDCSGKTTLWNKIHKNTKYRWKLEDRSFVTMLVYSQFRQDPKSLDYERQLFNDLSNLNVKYVIIDPAWDLVESRFRVRGDDVYNLRDLKEIHSLYHNVVKRISGFPNVLVFDGTEDSNEAARRVDEWLKEQNQVSISSLVKIIQQRAAATESGEVSPLRFTAIESGEFLEDEPRILNYSWVSDNFPAVKAATVEEFNKMYEELMNTVDKELKGENIYNTPQTLSSRRFVFTQNACVSFIQAMVRGGDLRFYVTCRSSHVYDVFPADIRLLYHMCKSVHKKLGLSRDISAIFEFTMNSAHTTF